jgi:hypothetical protein
MSDKPIIYTEPENERDNPHNVPLESLDEIIYGGKPAALGDGDTAIYAWFGNGWKGEIVSAEMHTPDVTVVGCKRCHVEAAVAAGLCAGCCEARLTEARSVIAPFGYAWYMWTTEQMDKSQGFSNWFHNEFADAEKVEKLFRDADAFILSISESPRKTE